MRIKITLFAALALILAGCGGQKDSDSTTDQTTVVAETTATPDVAHDVTADAAHNAVSEASTEGDHSDDQVGTQQEQTMDEAAPSDEELMNESESRNLLDELEKGDGKDLSIDESMLNGAKPATNVPANAEAVGGVADTPANDQTADVSVDGNGSQSEVGAHGMQDSVEDMSDSMKDTVKALH